MARNRTTIQDIADAIKVTSSTVSRALNNHPSISEATKKKVLEAASRLNYRPNRIAAALRSGRSMNIGVILPFADRAFFGAIIRGIEDEAARKGYGVIVCQTYDDPAKEKRALDTLLRSQVDGIISSVAQNASNVKNYKRVQEEGIPLLFIDRVIEQISVSKVTIDDFRGGYLATSHLIEQGCRRIAHFAGDKTLNVYRERYRGYCAALKEYKIPLRDKYIMECPSDVDLGRACSQKLMQLRTPPDAIFSSSDFAALGAIQFLKSKKIAIPGDVAIVGFANEPFTAIIEPALTTVDQHSREMGKMAAKTFIEELTANRKKPTRQVVLQPDLIVRASSQRISSSLTN